MLTRLRHWTISSTHHQDGTIHLSGAGDHILNVVGVTRTIDVGIVAMLGLVFQVGNRNRDTTFALLRSLINLVKGRIFGKLSSCQHFGDGCCQGRLAMVDVSNRSYVHMQLCPLKLLLSHLFSIPYFQSPYFNPVWVGITR